MAQAREVSINTSVEERDAPPVENPPVTRNVWNQSMENTTFKVLFGE